MGWGQILLGPSRVIRSITGFVSSMADTVGYGLMNPRALRRVPVRAVFYRQVYFTGIQALLPVAVAALAVGIGLQTQMRSLLGAGVEVNVRMLQLVVLREFAPLVTALIVLGRSGSAMATELASMKVRGEVRELYLMGMDPGDYLVVPRVWACVVVVPALTLVFQVIAAGAGPAVAAWFVEMEVWPYYRTLLRGIELSELVLSSVKTLVFGLVVAGAGCASGLFVPAQQNWVPQAAELSVMRGFIMLLLADLGFALVHLVMI